MEERELGYFYEIFDAGLERLGPGDEGSTRRALSIILQAAAGLVDDAVPDCSSPVGDVADTTDQRGGPST